MDSYHGRCYCGNIEFVVDHDVVPNKATYCHCDSCRRAHAAPLYHVVYVPKEAFHITKGNDFLQPFVKEANIVIRSFCRNCGTRICNERPAKPQLGVGFFPNLLDENIQNNLPEKFKPTAHFCHVEAVLPIHEWSDGLTLG